MSGDEGKKSGGDILGEFAEFLKAKQDSEREEDFAVNITTTDSDGRTHALEGIPISRAAKFLYDNFGIGEPPAAEGGDKGDEGGDKGKPPTLKQYFGGKAG